MNEYDAILHIDVPDPDRLKLVLRNAVNYLNGLPDAQFELDVVANGGAASLFTNDRQDLYELAIPVMDRGVIFKVCANALAEQGIPHDHVWPRCRIVPAGLVEIVRLQKAGFAYIKP